LSLIPNKLVDLLIIDPLATCYRSRYTDCIVQKIAMISVKGLQRPILSLLIVAAEANTIQLKQK